MTKLTYPTAAALVADFEAGAKFELRAAGDSRPVQRMTMEARDPSRIRAFTSRSVQGTVFSPSGISRLGNALLVKVSAAPKAATPAPQTTDPFDMKAFILGRKAINPLTGELVLGIDFSNDGIEVTLQHPVSNIVRTSKRYRHDGTHRHVAGRSLRLVAMPPPKRQMRLEVVKLDGGGFTARCLGLAKTEVPVAQKAVGERAMTGGFSQKSGVTVYAHDFEVDA